MATSGIQLPEKLAKKLDQDVPRDAKIYYDEQLGWVYNRSNINAGNVDQLPITQLGPFGTLSPTITLLLRRFDLIFQALAGQTFISYL